MRPIDLPVVICYYSALTECDKGFLKKRGKVLLCPDGSLALIDFGGACDARPGMTMRRLWRGTDTRPVRDGTLACAAADADCASVSKQRMR